MLKITSANVYIGQAKILHDINIEINAGEIVTLIGSNGAGKSTLMMAICGVHKVDEGQISFNGTDIKYLRTDQIIRLGIAHAPEGRRIFPRMSIMENLQMGAIATDPKYFASDLDKIFTIFPLLSERRKQMSGTLSGGEQQMLALARALMSRPQLLLLDEPSLGLAPLVVKQIFQVIKQINQDGMTILFVEQNVNYALNIAHRGYVIVNGRIALSGTKEDLLKDPKLNHIYFNGLES